MKSRLGAAAAALLLSLTAGARATTYSVNLDVANTNVSGTIDTDGTIGTLTVSDITSFDLTLTVGSQSFILNQIADNSNNLNGALSATATGLSYNFGVFSFLDFFQAGVAAFELIGDMSCTGGGQSGLCTEYNDANGDGILNLSSESGTVEFAQVTPLPATLPLFASALAGLGLLGWRRKRKAQAVA